MEERRKVQRHKVLKAGIIAIQRTSDISCRVRNLSPAGACLEVESQFGVPDEFVLLIDNDRLKQPCNVIWRNGGRLGVAFRASQLMRSPQAVPISLRAVTKAHNLAIRTRR